MSLTTNFNMTTSSLTNVAGSSAKDNSQKASKLESKRETTHY